MARKRKEAPIIHVEVKKPRKSNPNMLEHEALQADRELDVEYFDNQGIRRHKDWRPLR